MQSGNAKATVFCNKRQRGSEWRAREGYVRWPRCLRTFPCYLDNPLALNRRGESCNSAIGPLREKTEQERCSGETGKGSSTASVLPQSSSHDDAHSSAKPKAHQSFRSEGSIIRE